MWTILALLHPDGITHVPIKAYPTYMECGQAIPQAAKDYFPHGQGGWVVFCDETGWMSVSPIPPLRD